MLMAISVAPSGRVGVTALDGADSGPAPLLLLAWTVNVYAVPLVNPVTTTDVVVPLGVVAVFAVAAPLTRAVAV
jgi:hypothetical protein